MLWVALELPALPLQIAERGGASSKPMVISEGSTQRPTVACVNDAGRRVGIREGQAVAAAKALAGELHVIERDVEAEREALEALAAWALQYTPMACVEARGLVLEVDSTQRLFKGHARLTAAIVRGIRDMGFRASVGVAPTPLAARIMARAEGHGLQMRGCTEKLELRARLADLPLFLFDWPEKTLARLADLGVLRVKDILELPMEGIARRFGPEIALSLERLLGNAADARMPYTPPPKFRARLELPAEAESVEALLFPLKRLATQLEGYARGRGAGVQSLHLVLEHGRNARTRLDLEFASPERESDFILAIARERLTRLQLSAPTVALTLRADALLPYMPRNATWLPAAREQAVDRARLIERIGARLGRDRVFGIALANDHRPEKGWTQAPRKDVAATDSPRPVWLCERAQRLVTQEGRPSLQGALELLAGPERIEAGWWDGEEARRDYYLAANPHGERYWIYRDHRDPDAWYVHGIFA
jgi:protein ImuB